MSWGFPVWGNLWVGVRGTGPGSTSNGRGLKDDLGCVKGPQEGINGQELRTNAPGEGTQKGRGGGEKALSIKRNCKTGKDQLEMNKKRSRKTF